MVVESSCEVVVSEIMALGEMLDIERLTAPGVHHAIQRHLKAGASSFEVALALREQANCSLRVAKMVVGDAQKAPDYLYVSEISG
jgi:hypothetical protein